MGNIKQFLTRLGVGLLVIAVMGLIGIAGVIGALYQPIIVTVIIVILSALAFGSAVLGDEDSSEKYVDRYCDCCCCCEDCCPECDTEDVIVPDSKSSHK